MNARSEMQANHDEQSMQHFPFASDDSDWRMASVFQTDYEILLDKCVQRFSLQ